MEQKPFALGERSREAILGYRELAHSLDGCHGVDKLGG